MRPRMRVRPRVPALALLVALALAGCAAPPSTDPTPPPLPTPSPMTPPPTPTSAGAATGGAPVALANLAVDPASWALDPEGPRPVREFGEYGAPSILFRAPPGSAVVAPLAGVVRVEADRVALAFAARTVLLHGVEPTVADGARVAAGDAVARAGPEGVGLALVAGERAYCPMAYAGAGAREELAALYERWRDATGDETAYRPAGGAREGCLAAEMPWRDAP